MRLVGTLLVASTFGFAALEPASAQSVRGRVIDDSSGAPVAAVALRLVDASGQEIGTGARSVDDGSFRLHAPDRGTFRIAARRIGYAPRTSDEIRLATGEVVTVEIRISRVAQVVAPVRIVERAQMGLRDLMTTDGYELRRAKGIGRFVESDSIDPKISIYGPSMTFGMLAELGVGGMSAGPSVGMSCTRPQIYVDGLRMTGTVVGGSFRSVIDMPAAEIYGVEVYRKPEIPPASLGGPFGSELLPSVPCGIIAVWTKGRVRRLGGVPAVDEPALRGTLIGATTGAPIAGARVLLRTEHGTDLGAPVTTDTVGRFAIRIPFRGRFRLVALHPAHDRVTTTPFAADTGQTLIVQLTMAVEDQVRAPLTVLQRFYGIVPPVPSDSTTMRGVPPLPPPPQPRLPTRRPTPRR